MGIKVCYNVGKFDLKKLLQRIQQFGDKKEFAPKLAMGFIFILYQLLDIKKFNFKLDLDFTMNIQPVNQSNDNALPC